MSDDNRFVEEWRRWASRPPRRSPAMAAQAVRTELSSRRRRRPRWAAVLATAAALALAAAAALLLRGVPATGPTQVGRVVEAPQPGSGEVLLWLDADTPLYMTFTTDGAHAPGGDS